MSDPLLRFRSEFPILERTNYMISNSLGAMPRGVYDAMKGYADTWAARGVRAWEERWWMLAAQVLFYGLAAIDPWIPDGPVKRISSPARTFVVLFAAALAASRILLPFQPDFWKEA